MNLKKIFLNNIELSNLNQLNGENSKKSEGNFYFFPNDNYIMKIMKDVQNCYSAHGLKTIEILNKYKEILYHQIPEFILPETLVYIDNILSGYIMKYVYGISLAEYLSDSNIEFKDKINALKKIGVTLEKSKNLEGFPYNFSFGDLHEENIIITPDNNIKIIDPNGISLFDEEINSKYLKLCGNNLPFCEKYPRDICGSHIASIETDNLCYIMIIMNFISSSDFSKIKSYEIQDYLNYLEKHNFSSDFLNCVSKIYSKDSNVNPYIYLDNIDYQMVYNANIKKYKNLLNR